MTHGLAQRRRDVGSRRSGRRRRRARRPSRAARPRPTRRRSSRARRRAAHRSPRTARRRHRAVASHGTPATLTRTWPSGAAMTECAPLSSTTAFQRSAASWAHASISVFDLVRWHVEHVRELSRVRASAPSATRTRRAGGAVRRRRPRSGSRSASTDATYDARPRPMPDPTTQRLHLAGPDHDLGMRGPDQVLARALVAHHPDSPVATAADTTSTPAPVYCGEPATAPRTPRVYLCEVVSGRGSSRRTSSGCSDLDHGIGRWASPMSTSSTTPQARGGRLDELRHLVGPERHRHLGPHVRTVESPGVDLDARRHVHGHDRRASVVEHLGHVVTETGPAPDAERRRRGRGRTPSRSRSRPGRPPRAGRRAPARTRSSRRAARAPGPAPGQHGPGPERVAAVVPRTGHDQDA